MNRIFHTPDLNRVEFLDDRFYQYGEEYFPSVTTVLDVWPKGFGFNQWLKDVGNNAGQIVERAGKDGTIVHEAVEALLLGLPVKWANDKGAAMYTRQQWEMIGRAYEFISNPEIKILATETQVYSERWKVAGTVDLVAMIDGQIWLIDFKTSNALHTTHELQLAAYATFWNELCQKNGADAFKVSQTGILWLKALTRGPAKGKIQGKGWQLKTFDRAFEKAFKLFEHTKAIWDEENPDPRPANLIMPDTYHCPRNTQ